MLNKKERKVLDKVLKEVIGDVGFYIITTESKILYSFDFEKLISKYNDLYILNLPSIDLIKSRILEIYPDFDSNKLENIEYIFQNIVFDKKVIINSDADIVIQDCTFKEGLEIKKANKVQFISNHCLFNRHINEINCSSIVDIKTEELEFDNCILHLDGRNFNDSYIKLDSKKIHMQKSILLTKKDIYINADLLEVYFSSLRASQLVLNTEKIFELSNSFWGTELISINNKSCDSIKNVYSDKVLYNSFDVTQSEQMQLPNARKQLLEKLKELKNKCDEGIEEDTKKYQESLRKQPLSKRIKK